MAKAEASIAAARILLGQGHPEFAISRAYYAMFYLAAATLLGQGRRFKSHSGLHSAFADHVINAGALPKELHQWLVNAANERIIGDYSVQEQFDSAEAATQIDRATVFLERVNTYLGQTTLK